MGLFQFKAELKKLPTWKNITCFPGRDGDDVLIKETQGNVGEGKIQRQLESKQVIFYAHDYYFLLTQKSGGVMA